LLNQKIWGILFGLSAGAIWALETILGKFLFSSLTVIQIATSEIVFATFTALIYTVVKREKVTLDWETIQYLLLVSVVGTIIAPLLFYLGLSQTFAVNATLIAHMQPFFIALLGYSILKEQLSKLDLIGGILIILAAILITSRTIEQLTTLQIGNLGDFLVFLAMCSWAIVAIPGKRLTQKTSSAVIVSLRFLIASMILLPIVLILDVFIISSIYQVLLGLLVGLGYICYYESMKRLKTSQVAFTELSAPFFIALFAWPLLGEIVTIFQIIGIILLMSGVYILTQKE
jgi:drug/metabolite transporter (DMT)-like permease